jgi:hypothetical protein
VSALAISRNVPTAFQGGEYHTFLILAHVCTASVAQTIQYVAGGKLNIVGDHSIGYCKQILFIYMCPIPNGFRHRAISLYSSEIVNKKEILCTVSKTGIYLYLLVQFS